MRCERLDAATHDRSDFDCGVDELNAYFRSAVDRDVETSVTQCFVLVDVASPAVPLAYMTLAAASLAKEGLSAKLKRRFRYAQVPAARVGRLAVSTSAQGRGLGTRLIAHAAVRVARSDVAAALLLVDAKDGRAAGFYQSLGFRPLRGEALVLYAATSQFVSELQAAEAARTSEPSPPVP